MRSEQFVFWLQGYLELGGVERPDTGLTAKQVACIRAHIDLVFKHEIDPSMAQPEPKTPHEQKLDEAHHGTSPASGGGHNPFGPVYRC